MPLHDHTQKIANMLADIHVLKNDMADVKRAVVGNGTPQKSLLFRVSKIEENQQTTTHRHSKWEDRIWRFLIAVALAWLIANMSGCIAATRQINKSLSGVDESALIIREEIQTLKTIIPTTSPATHHLTKIDDQAVNIRKEVAKARSRTHNIEDKVPAWMTLLESTLWVVGLGLVAVLCIYFGVGKIVRPILQHFGYWISAKTRNSAAIDAKALSGSSDLREAIASRRSSDPSYNRAWKSIQRKKKTKPPNPPD